MTEGLIDLRSDTVTKPSPAMRAAMAAAEVGDDVFGDDPTVNRLERRAAELMGKEAALFVPSGTMANLIALLTHTNPGDEVILGDQSHIFQYEVGGAARIAGLVTRTIDNDARGRLEPEAVARAIRPATIHSPGTRLVCLENTHNRCGGAALDADYLQLIGQVARERGVALHLDGARIFNAAAALRLPALRLAEPFDSVSFCLSKGLGCPVGSLLCGSTEFIERARRFRKLLGGGMRQAGVLAACGLYALDHNIDRLVFDHENARRLAVGLRTLGPFAVAEPETNIVILEVLRGSVTGWLAAFEREGVLAVAFGPRQIRMVTHLDIDRNAIDEALARISRTVGALPA